MKPDLVRDLLERFEERVQKEGDLEFWMARDLQALLGYTQWRNFHLVLEKARTACINAGQPAEDHFADVSKMVEIAFSKRRLLDIALTRYACYLVAQNGDPRKLEIAFAQTYFALQTRKQELIEQRLATAERVHARARLSASEKELSGLIFERLRDQASFGRIRNAGDQTLFGGHGTQQMKKKLGVPEHRPLADYLPTITIKAKDFSNEITNFNVRRDDLRTEQGITSEHVKTNREVRAALSKRGILPEKLPAEEDVKILERRLAADEKRLPKEVPPLRSGGRKKPGQQA